MWKLEIREEVVLGNTGNPLTLERQSYIDESGTRISRMGSTREKEVIYFYQDSAISFEFKANRHNIDTGERTQKFVVQLGAALKKLSRRNAQKISVREKEIIKQKILTCLLSWYLPERFNEPPVTEVVFDMTFAPGGIVE